MRVNEKRAMGFFFLLVGEKIHGVIRQVLIALKKNKIRTEEKKKVDICHVGIGSN